VVFYDLGLNHVDDVFGYIGGMVAYALEKTGD
jgi:hypothetical protein